MKRFLIIVISLLLFSCEQDDFCTENPVTPNLVIRFFDKNDVKQLKKVKKLSIWAEAKDTIYKNISVDSLAIPLNPLDKKTIYNLSKGKNLISKITIEYEVKNEYISRSCGYKVIYDNLKATNTKNSWINSLSTTTKTINNQNNAHLKVYH